jgi:hypothetical protein
MMRGESGLLDLSAHTLSSRGGGDGIMGGDSDSLPLAGHAGASGYEAESSQGLADSASDAPSSPGTSHSFVDPHAPIDLNRPMGGAVGDTNSVDVSGSGWAIPSGQYPQAPADTAAGGDSQISEGYEADHSGRVDRGD